MSLPADLEPAVRDPKKLRLTALVLVVVMVVGGSLITVAYNKWLKKQEGNDRPSIVHRIQPERSLRVLRQDGKQADLIDLRGKVFALHVIHPGQLEDSKHSLPVMHRVAQHYADKQQADFLVVTLMLDPGEPDGLAAKLKQTAESLNMALPQWWLASSEPKTLQTFIRKELKPSVIPESVNGRWQFDPSIVLIDRNGHLRRAVVPQKQGGPPYVAAFDFDQAARWDLEGKLTGTNLDNRQQLELLLTQTIDKLLEEAYVP